jgi:TP901 family phage tail tape measure protein
MAVSNVELRVDARNALSGLRQVNRASSQLDGAINQLQRSLGGLAASFAGGFALSKVIQDVTELDRNLRRLGTVGGNIKELDKGLGALSQRLDGVANKAELAAASYQALSAGFTDTAGNLKLVEAATKAAVGGLADTTQVTEVLTKTLNAYNMSGEQAVKVTDSISKAIEYGQVQWSDYTSQLGRVASIAALAGVSLDEVNAFIAAATKNGATAEVAFTGLSAALTQILQPTKESQEAAKFLGIQWSLAGIQGKGFTGLMAELAKAQETNKEAASRLIGSQEGMRGVFAANAKAGKDYQMILQGLQGAAGKTDSDFNQMKVSLENQLKALDTAFKNLSEALGIAFGPAVIDSVGDLTGLINGFATAIKAIPQPVVSATVELVKLVAQMILLQKTMQGIIALRAAFVGALTASAGAVAATGAAATGSASAFALYTNNTKALAASAAAATPKLAALRGMLMGIAKIGIITVGINLVVTGLANAIKANQEIAKLRGQRAAGGAAAMYGGAAPKEAKAAAQQTLKAIQAERKRGVSAATRALGPLAGLVGAQTPADVIDRARVLRERELAARATLALPTRQEAAGGGGAGGGGGGGTYDPDADKKRDAAAKKAARDAERAAKAAAEEAARVQEVIRNRLAEGQVIRLNSEMQDKIAAAEASGDQMLAARLKGAQRELDIQYRYAQELAKETDLDAQRAIIFEGQTALVANQRDVQRELNAIDQQRIKDGAQLLLGKQQELALLQQTDPLKRDLLQIEQYLNSEEIKKLKLTDEQLGKLREILTVMAQIKNKSDEMKQLYTDIGMNIKSGVVDAIQSAVDGTKTLGQVASDVLRSIANKLLDVAVNMALFGAMSGTGTGGGVLGFLFKKRAMGGSVTGGKPYLVGEKGPELFMPGRSGGIAPTGSFGGGVNVVVNVDASGTSVQGNEPDAAQLGRAVSVAVQAEIIKQQRPGGLLAATRR